MALNNYSGEMFKVLQHIDGGWCVWGMWDEGAEVYDLYADPDGAEHLGCADTINEAKIIAMEYFQELMA
jgi:hypothetical protein